MSHHSEATNSLQSPRGEYSSDDESENIRAAAAAVDDDIPLPDPHGWTDENISWMLMWARQISLNAQIYATAGLYWNRLFIWLRIVSIVLIGFAVLILGPSIGVDDGHSCPLRSLVACIVLQWLSLVMSALGGVFASIVSFLEPNSKADDCKRASDDLHALASDIDLMVRAESSRRMYEYEFAQLIRVRNASIIARAPALLGRTAKLSQLLNRVVVESYRARTSLSPSSSSSSLSSSSSSSSSTPMTIARQSQPSGAAVQVVSPPLQPPLMLPPTNTLSAEDKRLLRELTEEMARLERHTLSTQQQQQQPQQRAQNGSDNAV